MERTLEERFWSKVDVKSDEECWKWKASRSSSGYGQLGAEGTVVGAHRIAWELHYKQQVPQGMCILHHCDNPICCNHRHLYCGTRANNGKDMIDRDRSSGFIKTLFTSKEVKEIRRLRLTVKQIDIANMLGVHAATISRICNSEKYHCRDGLYA